jgi:hypothetical protein
MWSAHWKTVTEDYPPAHIQASDLIDQILETSTTTINETHRDEQLRIPPPESTMMEASYEVWLSLGGEEDN